MAHAMTVFSDCPPPVFGEEWRGQRSEGFPSKGKAKLTAGEVADALVHRVHVRLATEVDLVRLGEDLSVAVDGGGVDPDELASFDLAGGSEVNRPLCATSRASDGGAEAERFLDEALSSRGSSAFRRRRRGGKEFGFTCMVATSSKLCAWRATLQISSRVFLLSSRR